MDTKEKKEKYYKKVSDGIKKHYASMTEDEKLEKYGEIWKKRGIKTSERFKNMSKEEMDEHIRKSTKWMKNLSPAEWDAYIEKQKNVWRKMSDERREELSNIHRDSWNNIPIEKKKYIQARSSETGIARWNDESYRKKGIIHLRNIHNNWLKNVQPAERIEINKKISASKIKWFNSLTDDEKDKLSKKMKESYNKIPYEKRISLLKRVLSKSHEKNNLHKKFEFYFENNTYLEYNYFSPEVMVGVKRKAAHSWDYGIYDENGELQMLVDIDGTYFHADHCDYDGLRSKEEYDEKRFLSVPDGVRYNIIQERKWNETFDLMIKELHMSYDEFILSKFRYCRLLPEMPYPYYKDEELLKSYDQLLKLQIDKYRNNISINNREGDRIINHFHHSIYSAKCKDSEKSPYDAWTDDEILLSLIKNHIICPNKLNFNKILQGFNICENFKKVDVFSAGRAKLLILQHLNEFDTVFDPFSGFSGRMLGAISAGKKYIGQDLSPIHIRESKQIVSLLQKYGQNIDVSLSCKDIMKSSGKYPCLFTCPPYADKEQWLNIPIDMRTCDDWIDICLERFQCKKYLFVVDDTVKYKDYIIKTIYFQKGKEEYIVCFEE